MFSALGTHCCARHLTMACRNYLEKGKNVTVAHLHAANKSERGNNRFLYKKKKKRGKQESNKEV
jgi:hypothetical protein